MENLLKPIWKETLKKYAPLAEAAGELEPEILEIVYREQWFKLFVPEAYGGPGKKLPEILRLEEELASVDGSLAWTVTLCSGAAWFAGFLDPALAKEVFADRKVCFAGSGAVGGTAIKTLDGYRINGHWKYASGALHATIFTANCVLQHEDGTDQLDENNEPIIRSFILKKEEVNILPGWSYFGLVATGSHAFEVVNVEIPANRSFRINNEIKVADQGFDYPFLQLAETTLVVNNLGMANHFIELVEEYFYKRSGLKRFNEEQVAFFKAELTRCKKEIAALRTAFYEAFDDTWNQLINKGKITEASLNEVSRLSRELAHVARTNVDRLYPYCGLEAAKRDSEINRVWRDIHTASQHALLTFRF
ncbi:acyl-CoA dehydrogenase family protein [Pedobacter sp. ASV12]|uniref:acyl-CoA dehydrogenase family protein n=1 Tax=Pedobacter sp. ASV12 TaxID=2795120 RepID=UPI0018ED9BCB|nr:acyl-CoA dehydrogenase family protein [Pedobacter sp. ASV12]